MNDFPCTCLPCVVCLNPNPHGHANHPANAHDDPTRDWGCWPNCIDPPPDPTEMSIAPESFVVSGAAEPLWRYYYYFGADRVAVREAGVLSYLFGDHLGSTTITANSNGTLQSEMRYKPWGEMRYNSGTAPTDYLYTGQRDALETDLYYYNARWYDRSLGRFAQADTLVPEPGNPMGWDRYAYVNNSPIIYTDSSGYYACGDGYEDECLIEQEQASYQLSKAGWKPKFGCNSDPLCADIYATLIQTVMALGRVPDIKKILIMTAGTEYFLYPDARSTGQEGLARNYYTVCESGVCTGNEIYKFLEGFQPWYGYPNVKGDGSSHDRASHLISKGLNNAFWGQGERLRSDAEEIVNYDVAQSRGWVNGKESNRPWQWFGLFLVDPTKIPSFGFSPNNTAILSINLGKGYEFWMFTGVQDFNFKLRDWEAK